jgi:N-acetylmuramoyl-L-alanine amidase CwlA
MSTIEKRVRALVREELLRLNEIAQHQDPSGRWEPEVWVGEEDEVDEEEEE